jgi:hypothetical protein
VKIGLVADSRGDVDALEHACDLLLEEKGAERVFFLGGAWNDLDELFKRKRAQARGREEYGDQDFLADVSSFLVGAASAAEGKAAPRALKSSVEAYVARFARVPDKESLPYRDPNVSRVLPDMIGDRLAVLVHDKADLKREDIEMATFLAHGNSAAPGMVQIGPRFFLTPGSLSGKEPRSVGLFSLEPDGVELVGYGLDGRELNRVKLQLLTRRKMSAQ